MRPLINTYLVYAPELLSPAISQASSHKKHTPSIALYYALHKLIELAAPARLVCSPFPPNSAHGPSKNQEPKCTPHENPSRHDQSNRFPCLMARVECKTLKYWINRVERLLHRVEYASPGRCPRPGRPRNACVYS